MARQAEFGIDPRLTTEATSVECRLDREIGEHWLSRYTCFGYSPLAISSAMLACTTGLSSG